MSPKLNVLGEPIYDGEKKHAQELEELSAVMNETASMAQVNAKNSSLALKLIKDAIVTSDETEKAKSLQSLGQLLAELSASSDELANGINQISEAIRQMEAKYTVEMN